MLINILLLVLRKFLVIVNNAELEVEWNGWI